MALSTVIQLNGISKVYKLFDKPLDRIKEAFHPFSRKYHREFYALRDVSFSVKKGEILGIVGKNGCGKSTVLQIITGVLTPTSGSVDVQGKVSALLELGAGFNPELSGIENIYFKSSIMGLSKQEIDDKLDSILEFANIGDFVRQPVKTYSSGMFVRLAFAVAINVDPDILIVDEALSVGDFRFRQKCLRKFDSFLEQNKTILFVTHDHGSVIKFCTRAIWLKDGKVWGNGDPGEVCKNYISFMSYGDDSLEYSLADTPVTLPEEKNISLKKMGIARVVRNETLPWQSVEGCASFGAMGAEIKRVAFFSPKKKKKIEVFEGGERVVFSVEFAVKQDIGTPIVGFHLINAKGMHVLGLNSAAANIDFKALHEGDLKVVEFEFDFPYLKEDVYSFSPAIAEGTLDEHIQHHWVHDACIVRIVSGDNFSDMGNQLVIKENFSIRSKCSG